MIPSEIDKIKLFFIIGRPRSGTTLLRTLLDTHPNVIVPTECPFILHLSKRYKKTNCPNRKTIDKIISDLQELWLFKETKIDVELLREFLYNYSGKLDYLTLCKIIILHYPDVLPKEKIILVGDKNPSYSLQFKRLYRLFRNECFYIQLLRDPRDQFLSLKNIKLEVPYISMIAKRWKYAYNTFKKLSKRNKKNFMIVKYEDIVSDPENILKGICKFLSISYNSDVLKFYEKKEEFRKQFSEEALKKTHKSLLNPIKANKVGLWKDLLTEKEKGISEIIAGKQLSENNYEVAYIERPIAKYFHAIPGMMLHYFTIFIIQISFHFPFNLYLKLSKGAVLGNLWYKYILRRKSR